MFHFRSSVFGIAAALAVCCANQAAQAEDNNDASAEPEFRFLAIAEALANDEVLPVQFEELNPFAPALSESVNEQAIQPIDVGGEANFADPSLPDNFGFADWSLISKAGFDSNTSSLVDSASFVEQLEDVQGTSEIALTESPAVEIVPAGTFNLTQTPDIGETLVESAATQTVKARRRSSLGFDPKIRGYYNGQVYTSQDGSYLFPARSDLDGVFSKIDPFLIGNVQVYSGPYTVRYGSGFAFLNIDTIATPRYECGSEHHLRLGTNLRTNGGQTYNSATFFGGGENMGYYANLGYRKGSDYAAGDGLLVPSSYDAFNLFSGIGFDLDDQTRSEFRYTHVTESGTEYAGQFFDVDALNSDGITNSVIHRNKRTGFSYRVDSWISNTEFNGDTAAASKRRSDFPVLQRVDEALTNVQRSQQTGPGPLLFPPDPTRPFFGTVDGELLSAGVRAGMTQEIDRDRTIGFGADVRYVKQQVEEFYDLNGFRDISGNPLGTITTGLPKSEFVEPGFYTEYSFSMIDFIESATGFRVAFAHTQADPDDVNAVSNFRDPALPPALGPINEDLDVSDVLLSYFLTNDIDLAPSWSLRVGGGYAERLPTLEQRYSDGLFLAIIQSGFSRLIGDPSLSKERNWQADIRLDWDYEYVRGRIGGFHSWIVDYVTYNANLINDPQGSRLLRAVNTEYATLTGFEYYGEADLVDGVQLFSSLNYLDGRDREIDQPLAGIFPLEGRLGIRLTDDSRQDRWGLEWGLRMVDNQDRLGTLSSSPGAGQTRSDVAVVTLETPTPGFTTSYLRGYLRPRSNVNVTFGAENLFDNNYYEHLNLRIPPQGSFGNTVVLSPGLTPYFGVEVDY
ncbi:TonB-dependent receptor [Stieleria sp. JC731]|uniref:TonB-dependent receptor plug domain-containing protein n=1 Tax=Pirellulaceae TaxID=2691357 RepID=UPI001E4E9E73|nr:TonB-dependent receptor plug domain-containing protein [Stieleria sp. JC731]MCC9602981.1 TonB-dependent receptor [Stieleria sp. JC731]